jgi:hypothetical protein
MQFEKEVCPVTWGVERCRPEMVLHRVVFQVNLNCARQRLGCYLFSFCARRVKTKIKHVGTKMFLAQTIAVPTGMQGSGRSSL